MAFLLHFFFLSIVNVIFIHSCKHIGLLFVTWSSSKVQFLNTIVILLNVTICKVEESSKFQQRTPSLSSFLLPRDQQI